MFSIVIWLDSSPAEVSAVPSNWLSEDADGKYSYWPPTSADRGMFKNCTNPKDDWPKFRVRLIGKAGIVLITYYYNISIKSDHCSKIFDLHTQWVIEL